MPTARRRPGGCVVESRNGEIDAQVETQVASVSGPLLAMAEAVTPVEAGRKQA